MKLSMNKTPSSSRRLPTWMLALGAATVGAAAIVQERSRNAERNHPPIGKFVTVDGVRLHYVEVGQGEPLVLLHGNTMMALDFLLGDLVAMAARNRRVLVFDRPGYGHSERPRGRDWSPEAQAHLLHGALLQIGVRNPVVLGHSWGTMVALSLALDHPGFVRSLVLESGYYYPTLRLDVPLASIPTIPVLGDLLRYTFSPLMARASWTLMVKTLFAPAKVPDYFWEFPAWMAFRPSQMRALTEEGAEMVSAARRLSKRYGSLQVPAVIIAGTGDPIARPGPHSVRLHAELERSELRTIKGVGHMLHHLVPDEVLNAIVTAEALAPGMSTSLTPVSRDKDPLAV
jgi:pimeloyl-ACP methyl ester carboxylesterase